MNKWKKKAIKDLNTIISNQSEKSYLQANRKQDGSYYKKHRPYSITEESKKALGFINILNNDTVTLGQEEEIKAFLIPFRTFRNFI